MSLQLRYFASVRETLGAGEAMPYVPGETVAALRQRLHALSQAHAMALADDQALRCAVNQTLCGMDTVLADGAEVAFFPPVTGG